MYWLWRNLSLPFLINRFFDMRLEREKRILLTEDKDFGEWVFAHGEDVSGVILIRFPANARRQLGEEIKVLVDIHGLQLMRNFVVLEPGRAIAS